MLIANQNLILFQHHSYLKYIYAKKKRIPKTAKLVYNLEFKVLNFCSIQRSECLSNPFYKAEFIFHIYTTQVEEPIL